MHYHIISYHIILNRTPIQQQLKTIALENTVAFTLNESIYIAFSHENGIVQSGPKLVESDFGNIYHICSN